MTISKGKIVRYNPERLFGFIRPSCGGLDVFFHVSSFINPTCNDNNKENKERVSQIIYSMLDTPHEVEYLTRVRVKKDGSGYLDARDIELYLV